MPAASQSRPVISLTGTFDLPSARLLENSLRRIAPSEVVVIDFAGVRQFNDFAVAVLAQALKARAPGTKVQGLSLHQVRLLRYFGVDAAVFRR